MVAGRFRAIRLGRIRTRHQRSQRRRRTRGPGSSESAAIRRPARRHRRSRGTGATIGRIRAGHIAIAVTNGIDYLVTWNCRHIANATTRSQIERVCRSAGYEPTIICTPAELMEPDSENED